MPLSVIKGGGISLAMSREKRRLIGFKIYHNNNWKGILMRQKKKDKKKKRDWAELKKAVLLLGKTSLQRGRVSQRTRLSGKTYFLGRTLFPGDFPKTWIVKAASRDAKVSERGKAISLGRGAFAVKEDRAQAKGGCRMREAARGLYWNEKANELGGCS